MAGGGGSLPPTNSRRLGEPAPGFVILLAVAFEDMGFATCCGVRAGLAPRVSSGPPGTGPTGPPSLVVRALDDEGKLLKELDESFRKSGDRHSPHSKTWSDRVKDLFKA